MLWNVSFVYWFKIKITFNKTLHNSTESVLLYQIIAIYMRINKSKIKKSKIRACFWMKNSVYEIWRKHWTKTSNLFSSFWIEIFCIITSWYCFWKRKKDRFAWHKKGIAPLMNKILFSKASISILIYILLVI